MVCEFCNKAKVSEELIFHSYCAFISCKNNHFHKHNLCINCIKEYKEALEWEYFKTSYEILQNKPINPKKFM